MDYKFADSYFKLDKRSEAAFRISFALWLLLDLALRLQAFADIYAGNWVNFEQLRAIQSDLSFSMLWGAKAVTFRYFCFFITGIAYICLALGFHRRTASVLSAIGFFSIINFNHLTFDGGDAVAASLLVLNIFLPESSVAIFASRIQVAWIYLSAAICKTGVTWMTGTAIWYVSQYDQMATALGKWLPEVVPLGGFRILSYGALGIEFVAPILLLLPTRTHVPRRLGLLLLVLLQAGIASTVHTGFQLLLSSSLLLFLRAEDWDLIAAKVSWLGKFPILKARQVSLWRNRALNSVCAYWVLANAALALYPLNIDIMPPGGSTIVAMTRAIQKWDLFAPDAPMTDGWWILYGIDHNGREIDLFSGQVLSREKPSAIWSTLGRYRFKVLESLTFQENLKQLRGTLVFNVTREFQILHPEVRLTESRLSYIEEKTSDPNQGFSGKLPTVEFPLWKYQIAQEDPLIVGKSDPSLPRALLK